MKACSKNVASHTRENCVYLAIMYLAVINLVFNTLEVQFQHLYLSCAICVLGDTRTFSQKWQAMSRVNRLWSDVSARDLHVVEKACNPIPQAQQLLFVSKKQPYN